MSLANHIAFLEKSNISWHLGTVSGAGWISWDFHLPNFQVTYRLSSFGKLFISGRVKQKPPPKKTKEMERFNHQILGQVDGTTTKMTSWITCFFLRKMTPWIYLSTSIPQKLTAGTWKIRVVCESMCFCLFQHLANINRPFNFSGGSQ